MLIRHKNGSASLMEGAFLSLACISVLSSVISEDLPADRKRFRKRYVPALACFSHYCKTPPPSSFPRFEVILHSLTSFPLQHIVIPLKMKICLFTVALFTNALALALPQNNGGKSCPQSLLYSVPRCCETDVLGVADLDYNSRE